jgi:hypothetical protein
LAIVRQPDKPDRKGRTFPLYEKREWEQRPFEYSDSKWSNFYFTKHQVGPAENLKRIAAKSAFLIDWKELTLLNWGTDDPEVVNWYLHEHCGCEEETGDRKNYRFSNSIYPARTKLWEFVWVPEALPPPPPLVRIPIAPKTPNKIAPEICPHLNRGRDTCKIYTDLESGAEEDCDWPVESYARKSLTLESDSGIWEWILSLFGRDRKKPRRTTTQLAETYGIYRVQYDIQPRLLPYAIGLTNEKVTMLSFAQASEFNKKLGVFNPTKRPGAGSAKFSKSRTREETWPADVPLANPDQMERIATELKCMLDEGVLRRLVAHGFADHNECGGNFWQCMALSKRRADWVIDELRFRFRLPIEREPDANSSPADKQHYDERIAIGFVPALAVDCGSHYSKHNNPDELLRTKPHQNVILEVELGEPTTEESAPASPSISKAFGWYLYEFSQTGHVHKALFSLGTKNSGFADTEARMTLMVDEALSFLDLVEQILRHEKAPQSSMDNISELKLWVREEWVFTGTRPLPQLSNEYFAVYAHELPSAGKLMPVDECVPGEQSRDMCAPWIALPSSKVYANHSRVPTVTPVEFTYSSIEEKIAKQPESISWGPLILDFKKNQPAAP